MTDKKRKSKQALAGHLALGRRGEALAADYLTRIGFKVLDRNLRTRYGEIDLVCLDREIVVFVEIKTRTSSEFGAPREAVNLEKRRRLSRAALWFITQKAWDDRSARFDVVEVSFDLPQAEINHVTDAFDLVF